METITIHIRPSYNVHIGYNILENFPQILDVVSNVKISKKALFFIITDKNVARHYLVPLKNSLRKYGYNTKHVVLRPGEKLKSPGKLFRLLQLMVKKGVNRDSVVVNLGGGVIGDLGGFAAAIYMRGCRLMQVPTTLLAQVDSSIGGKVGINLPEGKNLVGSFYNPMFVLSDLSTLSTLQEREIVSGLAEIIKSGLIFHRPLYEKIKNLFCSAASRDNIRIPAFEVKTLLLKNREFLQEAVSRSVNIKGEIIKQDERESNLRMILNFGHTFGHAVEKITRYRRFLHGEAVMLGMQMATELSMLQNMIDSQTGEEILTLLRLFQIPFAKRLSTRNIYKQIGIDKKKREGKVAYILLKEPGYAVAEKDISRKKVYTCVDRILSFYKGMQEKFSGK
jgi:3-dehydroquinate synthase